MLRMRKTGQTTLEVVILIGFVVAALIFMGVYMKRGIQGRLRASTDQVGEQYSAGNTTGVSNITTETSIVENEYVGGGSLTQINVNEQIKTGHEEIADFTSGW